jgi:CRP-like cAMP-binding protein
MEYPRSALDIRSALKPTVFGQIGEEALDSICACARVERYEKPVLLNAAGQHLESLRFVVQGHIEVIARGISGTEVVLSYVTPGGWATWLPCFLQDSPMHDLCSSASSCFIAIPTIDVRWFCVEYPQIYPLIISEIGKRMRMLMEWTGQSVLVGPEQRMAKLLHIIAKDQNMVGNAGTLHLTQARLASLARCSRQTANGLLNLLEKRGLISVAYGKFEILDLQRLGAFAEEDVPN